MKKKFFYQPKNIIITFILLAILMISSAVIELYQSKLELYDLMEKESSTLLETLIIASTNSLKSRDALENLYKSNLLNNANLVKTFYESNRINNSLLRWISDQNKIHRISIFNESGEKIYFSHADTEDEISEKKSPQISLEPIFSGEADTLIFGITKSAPENRYQYTIAVSAKNRNAIVLEMNAENILKFNRDLGFGNLLKKIKKNPQIVYVVLQDTANILAATENVTQLESISESEFLTKSYTENLYLTRTVAFDSLEIFEAVKPFIYDEMSVGIFRMGLSMKPIADINTRIYRRLIIISIVLILVGTVLFTLIIIRQRYDLLQKQYKVVEAYSSDIIEHVSDAIIVLNSQNKINVFNRKAEELFEVEKKLVSGSKYVDIPAIKQCVAALDKNITMQQIDCHIKDKKKFLLISKAEFKNETDENNVILVIRDLTEQKQLEEQIQRNERLTAMGELASGVAHEIRNPLNTIGTIVQQLRKDYEPKDNSSEYDQLTNLVYQEVRRINDTIQDFLRFARPEPLTPQKFQLADLLNQIEKQYFSLMQRQKIEFKIISNWSGEVVWDRKQILQVLINLLENAIEAISKKGIITLTVYKENETEIILKLADDGPGMEKPIVEKIFNLYFTTKAKGTGIGLSVVQRIIYEHHGLITVESQSGEGTIFYIKLPVIVEKKTVKNRNS